MLSAVGMYGRAVQDGRAAVERALLAPSLRHWFSAPDLPLRGTPCHCFARL